MAGGNCSVEGVTCGVAGCGVGEVDQGNLPKGPLPWVSLMLRLVVVGMEKLCDRG